MKTETILVLDSEKKHSVRYDARDDKGAMTSVYIMKSALKPPYPVRIKVTVEEDK
jgi:hypothetical protein